MTMPGSTGVTVRQNGMRSEMRGSLIAIGTLRSSSRAERLVDDPPGPLPERSQCGRVLPPRLEQRGKVPRPAEMREQLVVELLDPLDLPVPGRVVGSWGHHRLHVAERDAEQRQRPGRERRAAAVHAGDAEQGRPQPAGCHQAPRPTVRVNPWSARIRAAAREVAMNFANPAVVGLWSSRSVW